MLSALAYKPRVNLIRCKGMFAPKSEHRVHMNGDFKRQPLNSLHGYRVRDRLWARRLKQRTPTSSRRSSPNRM